MKKLNTLLGRLDDCRKKMEVRQMLGFCRILNSFSVTEKFKKPHGK
jgi:hypothetical protein